MSAPRTIRVEIGETTLARVDHLVQVGTLVGTFAHELNNCLQVIGGLADLVKDDPGLPPATVRRIERILAQADRGSACVRAVLGFARERSLVVARTSLADLADGVLSLRSYPLSRLGVDVRVERERPGPFEVVGSPRELEQLIYALVLNAERTLAEVTGRRRLDVAFSADHGMVRLRVSDNGPGVAPALHESMFEPFAAGCIEGEPAGLGLAAARAIAERLGGALTVDSGPGAGTTLVVALPTA